MPAPLTVERRRLQSSGLPGFSLRGSDGRERLAFWITGSAYVDAELRVEIAMLQGSQEDLSPVLEAIRYHAAALASFGLADDDLAYVMMCLQGISYYRADLWLFPDAEGDAQDDDLAAWR